MKNKNDLLEDYSNDAERFKNFLLLLLVVGMVIGTFLTLIYLNI